MEMAWNFLPSRVFSIPCLHDGSQAVWDRQPRHTDQLNAKRACCGCCPPDLSSFFFLEAIWPCFFWSPCGPLAAFSILTTTTTTAKTRETEDKF